MEFWAFRPQHFKECCRHRLLAPAEPAVRKGTDASAYSVVNFTTKPQTLKQTVWELLEYPASSSKAMAYMVASCAMVLVATGNLIASSLPQFQQLAKGSDTETLLVLELEITDSVCVGWFTVEYFLRLWAAPDRKAYLKSPLSLIDVFAILPYFLELLLDRLGVQLELSDLRRSLVVMRILRMLRVLRALRVLKVARYSSGFQSVGNTLQRSWRELALLVMFLLVGNLIFSTALYYLEVDTPHTHFTSIPEACWWGVITMTTVGYGDVYPKTVAGKLLGGLVSITGIVLLAFPISVIVETFNQEYANTAGHKKKPKAEAEENSTSVSPGGKKLSIISTGRNSIAPVGRKQGLA